MKILVLDNYDSFTYNLVHIIREIQGDEHLDIFKNDQIALKEIDKYDKILLSPGPSIPTESGILLDVIKTYHQAKSILGVCLGYQAIGEVFDASLYNMPHVLHGIASNITVCQSDILFEGLPTHFKVCRYHSWAIRPKPNMGELIVTAKDEKGDIMAIKHKKYEVRGVQFHPESILSEHGVQIIDNWLKG